MKKIFTILLFSALTMTTSWSQTVDGILSKYFESIGGVEKWKSLKTLKMTGTVPTPQGDFAFEMSRKAPNKYMISLDVMGQKMIPQAYDGETAWMLNPFIGNPAPQKLPEDQAKALKSEADFEDPFIDYVKKGYEVTYEGDADVDGIKCYILKLIKNKGQGADESIMRYYLDNETYLPMMLKQKSDAGQMAGQEVDIYFSDYQDAGDGLIMPFTMDTKVGGQSVQAIKFNTVMVNVEIPDEIFKFPTEATPAAE
jgi:outer membrane lipoprotein-sorting protein